MHKFNCSEDFIPGVYSSSSGIHETDYFQRNGPFYSDSYCQRQGYFKSPDSHNIGMKGPPLLIFYKILQNIKPAELLMTQCKI